MVSLRKHALLVLTLCIIGCSETPTEEQIRTNIEELEVAIESKKTSQVLKYIHNNFMSEKGQDKLWVNKTLTLHALRHHNIELLVSNINIEIKDPQTLYAEFTALATGGKGLLPDQGSIYRVETEWRNEDNDWLIIHASWKKI